MSKVEFQKRRQQIMKMIESHSMIIIPSAPLRNRSRDIGYRFRQDSDFYYLTGFDEPNSLLALVPGRSEGEFIIFCQERDKIKEQWEGKRNGPEGAMSDFNAHDAYPIEDIDEILPALLKSKKYIYYPMYRDSDFDTKINSWMNLKDVKQQNNQHQQELISLDHLLHDMRLFKSKAEVTAIRKAAKIAVRAHENAIKKVRPNMFEYELESEFIYEFRKFNAEHSYNPIVGGGANACILHYASNDAELMDGDLVLIDAGCEADYYASDITRTFPVNGRFSQAQLDIYNIVLEAQLSAINKVRKGNHFNDPHHEAVKVITSGLRDLGLLHGKISELIENEAYRRFFMHRTGHWIGMDVHDVGDYKVDEEWRFFENGMITTIEPGIYIGNEKDIPKSYRNIGIRIEDMVLVKNNTPEVLSHSLVKDPDAIELMMNAQ
jgi:Xaa-Pro aminopeptidase